MKGKPRIVFVAASVVATSFTRLAFSPAPRSDAVMPYFVPGDRTPTFSDFLRAGIDRFEVAGTRCERRGSYDVRRMIEARGDVTVGSFLATLREPCPKSHEPGAYGVCGANSPDLCRLYPPLAPYVPRPDRGVGGR